MESTIFRLEKVDLRLEERNDWFSLVQSLRVIGKEL